jgi:hypothetical protein
MARIRSARNRSRHESGWYRWHALKHPAQALVFVTPAILATVTVTLLVPLIVLLVSELLVLAILPHCAGFRKSVDERLEAIARAKAAEARVTMLTRINDDHRIELENLERITMLIRERCGQSGEEAATATDDWLGLGRVLAVYVRLAMAYRTSMESFRAVDRLGLAEHIARLETQRITASESTRPWVERRLAIARRRVIASQRAQEECERLAQGLATIGELVRWMYEECVTTRSEAVQAELEEALASWEQSGATLHELSTLCGGVETVDMDVLALGRDMSSCMGPIRVSPDIVADPIRVAQGEAYSRAIDNGGACVDTGIPCTDAEAHPMRAA